MENGITLSGLKSNKIYIENQLAALKQKQVLLELQLIEVSAQIERIDPQGIDPADLYITTITGGVLVQHLKLNIVIKVFGSHYWKCRDKAIVMLKETMIYGGLNNQEVYL